MKKVVFVAGVILVVLTAKAFDVVVYGTKCENACAVQYSIALSKCPTSGPNVIPCQNQARANYLACMDKCIGEWGKTVIRQLPDNGFLWYVL